MTTFIQPTRKEAAVRNELAEISRLDERDATRLIVGRIDEVRALLEKSEHPTAIAFHLHMSAIVGLNAVEEAAVMDYLTIMSTGTLGLRQDVSEFNWLEFEHLCDTKRIKVPARDAI